MVKKLVKKKTISKKKKSKKTTGADNNFGSSGILVLGIIGIVVLIALALPKNNNSEEMNNTITETEKDESIEGNMTKEIIIDGLIYPSKEYAKKVLKDIPQTQRTEEQDEFLMAPDSYSK
jgi:hypothetical protein